MTLNYKELFNRAVLLLSTPAKAWEEIANESNRNKVMSEFVYPMIGLCGLSVFIGTFIGNTVGVSAFQVAMTRCCATFVSLFGGFFLASYLMNLLGKNTLGREDEKELNQQFVGYAMVVLLHWTSSVACSPYLCCNGYSSSIPFLWCTKGQRH